MQQEKMKSFNLYNYYFIRYSVYLFRKIFHLPYQVTHTKHTCTSFKLIEALGDFLSPKREIKYRIS